MSDSFTTTSIRDRRRAAKGLTLPGAPINTPSSSDGNTKILGAPAKQENNTADALEIGLEFRLDLRSEDLIVLREIGAGNGGTVSKVKHVSTNVIMARKVGLMLRPSTWSELIACLQRSSESTRVRRCAGRSSGNCKSDKIATQIMWSPTMVPFRMMPEILSFAWSTWTAGMLNCT